MLNVTSTMIITDVIHWFIGIVVQQMLRVTNSKIFIMLVHHFFDCLLHRCVMKMDHHCPWINTCCGHLNHSSFTYFLFFAPIGCMHACWILVMSLYYGFNLVSNNFKLVIDVGPWCSQRVIHLGCFFNMIVMIFVEVVYVTWVWFRTQSCL